MRKPELFRKFLGHEKYATLPKEIRYFHENSEQQWQGTAQVTGDHNMILKLLRKLNGLPAINHQVPVSIKVHYHNHQEIWQRQFGNSCFTSTMGFDAAKQSLYEKVGLLRFYFRPQVRPYPKNHSQQALHWEFQYATLLGIKIPHFLAPEFLARESVSSNNNYQFKAYVRLPILGVLVNYEGELYPPSIKPA